ncbi:MAG: hypothetical protein HYV27_02385 [Candidatus Hydrogenedentes bacterium]|nr:hypothetical protein [Candidatus Hydrogenedentota bacterium]
MTKLSMLSLAASMALFASLPAFAGFAIPEDPLWQPIVDEVYLQENATLIPTKQPIHAVASFDGRFFAGDDAGIWSVQGESLVQERGPGGPVHELRVLDGALWAITPNGLWRFADGAWSNAAKQPVSGLCFFNGTIVVASGPSLYALEGGGLVPIAEGKGGDLLGITAYSGTVYVHDGKRIGLLERDALVFEDLYDWGKIEPGSSIRSIQGLGSRLYLSTGEGLNVLRGMSWYPIKGEDGLCYEDTTCVAPGFDHDLWIGTTQGAIRNVKDEYQFFGHARWLPNGKVNAIACGSNAACIATDGGLGIVTYEPYTLAKKAAYYERWLREWGQKRLGFIHSLNLIDGEWVREVSDNDVGYSSHYFSAKCFEFAVTGNPAARAEAVDMMKSMKWSEEITAIDGFPARSIYAVGEPTLKAMHGSGGLPAEWHPDASGLWEWKGDTSSDETDAHAYATSIFLSLVANDEERVWATDHLRRVMGHIVDNGFLLRDVDGKPTRWARWDPEYLQTPYGYYARGLNGMEAFNYMTTALHFTGDAKFQAGREQLLGWNYLGDILRQKLTFPSGGYTHFDDRLAFYSYFPLVQFETDPDLKSLWLRSLERSWEVKRIEALPWFNFIYGALTGNDCEADRAVAHLREWPLDLRKISYTNSHRDDLITPPGYRAYAERTKPFSPREIEPGRWDADFMRIDGSGGGNVVADSGGWLDAYWMGRYYGFITAPQTDDPELITVPERGLQVGAKPYAGPARPKLKHEQ